MSDSGHSKAVHALFAVVLGVSLLVWSAPRADESIDRPDGAGTDETGHTEMNQIVQALIAGGWTDEARCLIPPISPSSVPG